MPPTPMEGDPFRVAAPSPFRGAATCYVLALVAAACVAALVAASPNPRATGQSRTETGKWNAGTAAALPLATWPSPTGSGELDIEGIAAYSRFRRFTVETREEVR